jgi:hypothetical protein
MHFSFLICQKFIIVKSKTENITKSFLHLAPSISLFLEQNGGGNSWVGIGRVGRVSIWVSIGVSVWVGSVGQDLWVGLGFWLWGGESDGEESEEECDL